jgi:transcriptional regulator with XRE-family HTH domain
MDITSFRHRMGLSQAELAEKLGLATGSVGNLCSGTKRPSYEVIEKLFLLGARLDEVFSPEVQEAVLRNCGGRELPAVPAAFDTPEFRDGVKAALADLQRMGYIKDIGANEKDGQ